MHEILTPIFGGLAATLGYLLWCARREVRDAVDVAEICRDLWENSEAELRSQLERWQARAVETQGTIETLTREATELRRSSADLGYELDLSRVWIEMHKQANPEPEILCPVCQRSTFVYDGARQCGHCDGMVYTVPVLTFDDGFAVAGMTDGTAVVVKDNPGDGLAGVRFRPVPAVDGVLLTSEDIREQADARLTRGGFESIDDTANRVTAARDYMASLRALAEREAK